ncbi:MAG TPA: hypothetical protein VFO19_23745, partial [Vicinamibacterales bacterium]|nr:hypothetical protein [Vicinamibacterales bacterium]
MSRRPHRLRHRLVAAALSAVFAAVLPGVAAAQIRENQRVITVLPDTADAQATREAFREILRSYPPALSRILRLDPQLMANDAYLAPYPSVAQFLKTHPEILRNPSFYIPNITDSYDGATWRETTPEQEARRQVLNMWENTLAGIMAFMVFIVVTLTLVWILRFVVSHRRWLRASRVQQEVHGRLLERLASNEELLAYVKSEAGRDFLQTGQASLATAEPTTMFAPYGRILLSVQAGVVLLCGGAGLLIVRDDVIDEVNQMLLTLGTLGVALGTGFIIAAIATYIL